MNVKNILSLVFVVFIIQSNSASAVGIGDFISAGINVVGKVGGAAIDKAMQDSPEEMEQKRLKAKADQEAKFHEAIAKVEARTDITPLEKEKFTRQISKTFGMAETISNLAAQQEMNRREQRDQMFTAGGMAGVVGNAAMNTPSAMMARADIAVKTGAPQAESRRAIAGADALMKTGQPQAQSRAAVEAAMTGGAVHPSATGVQPGGTQEDRARVAAGIQGGIAQHQGDINKAIADVEAAKPKTLLTEPEATNLAVLDKGRKVYVEFVGSKKLTEQLQSAFKDNGHTVVASAAEAEVVYQFDGEYVIGHEGSRDNVIERVGAYSDNPHTIEPPQQAQPSAVKTAVGGFFAAMAGIPIKQPSVDAGAYKQAVLVVANRHFNGQDARVSALAKEESGVVEADMLITNALQELVATVGVSNVKHTEAITSVGHSKRI